ncbi:MAG: DUF4190 domain-containing protein [Candidatus Microsaccharimonas sp.]
MASPAPTPQKSSEEKALEWILPINRSGWAIAAGYVAMFSFPLLFIAPIALILGIVGLLHANKKQKLGKGRAIFAIVYGGIMTVLFLILVVSIIGKA